VTQRGDRLTTTPITKLLTNPLAQSRSTAGARDQSAASESSTTQADCRWHGRDQGFESPKPLSRGILETIDMDSYRVERQSAMKIALADTDVEIEPPPASGGGHKAEPELDLLSNIVKAFNDQWGNIGWTDEDRIQRLRAEDIPLRVSADRAYQNAMRNNDKQNARIEHDKALARVVTAYVKDDTDFFKLFSDNESFRKWLSDSMFAATYEEAGRRSA
jgi:type I restriction enzyme R subunit